MHSVTVECFASAVNPGMAFFAHNLNIVALISAAILELNDVMRFKWHHWL